jgi:non-specific protein-tyrosine kinase
MSKLKKALDKAQESRGRDNQKGVRGAIKAPRLARVTLDESAKMKEKLDIRYSETRVQKIENSVLKKGKIISHFYDTDKIDQIKTLRTQILNTLDKIHGNSFLVTSANPYEGKTFTSINLGVSIAQEMHRTVLIVDCDLRDHHKKKHKQFTQDFFGLGTTRGLSDYLLGNAEITDILLNPGIERLVIVPAGTTLPNSAELLGSPKMAALVDDFKNRYPSDRVIIFDCSALLAHTDSLVLTRYVDGILLVVEEKRTTTDQIKKVMELLKDKPILGSIINKTR